jgi:hypothetical protein
MTTSHSPLRVLKAQADKIAQTLKAIDRGETVANDPLGKIAASRVTGIFTYGIVMDDKIIKIEMPWSVIHDTSEVGIAEYVLKQMKDARETAH